MQTWNSKWVNIGINKQTIKYILLNFKCLLISVVYSIEYLQTIVLCFYLFTIFQLHWNWSCIKTYESIHPETWRGRSTRFFLFFSVNPWRRWRISLSSLRTASASQRSTTPSMTLLTWSPVYTSHWKKNTVQKISCLSLKETVQQFWSEDPWKIYEE